MNFFLLFIAMIIVICVLSHQISDRLGIPMLLIFIVLGMLFGSDGIFEIPFDNLEVSEKICSTALIIIMFYGGFGTKWESAKPVAKKAIALSTLGVFFTAMLVGLFCHYVLHMAMAESFLIGALISSTDAASVFSILRSKRLNLKEGTASLLEIESGSNDPCAYMLTMIILTFMEGKVTAGDIFVSLFLQIFWGLAVGFGLAIITEKFMKKYDFGISGFDTAFVLAIAILSYALSGVLGGNGYLSTYITGIHLGNQWIPNKKVLVHFFDGLTSIMQMLIFFLLGLLSFPSQLPGVLMTSLAITLFLTFVARPISVFALLTPMKSSKSQQLLVSFCGLRGAASIVFAIMATIHEASFHNDVFHIIFCIVLFSIALQGTLIPFAPEKLNMVDENENVLKTFNDYSKEANLTFMQAKIDENHEWLNKTIESLRLPSHMLIVLVIRNGHSLVPDGATILKSGDELVLSGLAYENSKTALLRETKIEHGDERIGKKLSELSGEIPKLVVLIKRDESFFIPDGKTVLLKDDVLVYH